jgi:lysophospholipase L1-like esterase
MASENVAKSRQLRSQGPCRSICCRRVAGLAVLAIGSVVVAKNPTPDPDPQRFAKGIAAFERWDRKNAWPADPILFVGSSSIRMWPTRESFPRLPVLNRGFGGAHISDVNHYFDRVVAPYSPQAIVFYCGDNDISAGKTPERVLADYRRFVDLVRARFPNTVILYIPIKPSTNRWKHWPRMRTANALIAEFVATDDRQTVVDIVTPMLNGQAGPPAADLFLADGLHLSDQGYRIWNERVAQALVRWGKANNTAVGDHAGAPQ